MSDSDDDDNLLLEAMENFEKCEGQESLLLSTPPDSKILGNLRMKENASHTSIEDEALASTSGENNFRSQLMKSLLNNRNLHGKVSHSTVKSLSDESFSHGEETNKKRKSAINISSEYELVSSKITSNSPELLQEIQIQSENFSQLYSCSDDHVQIPCLPEESHTNVSQITDNPVSSLIRKRKFPGPAGLLPQWGYQNLVQSRIKQLNSEDSDFQTSKDSVCSQTSAQNFVSAPWKQMLFDLAQTERSFKHLLEENNIRWILRRATLRGPAAIRKIALIWVMVRSIDLSHLDAPAVFQDETGEINGTISKGVLEQYSDHISNGTVLILRDVTILSPASFQSGMRIIGQLKKHYLNITLNSVVSIYSSDDEEKVRKIEVIKLTKELIKSLSDPEGRKVVVENEETVAIDEISLFNNFGQRKESIPQIPPNVHDFGSYKTPLHIGAKSPALVRNVSVAVSQGSPQVLKKSFPEICKSPQPHSNTRRSPILPKFVSPAVSKPRQKFEPFNKHSLLPSDIYGQQHHSWKGSSLVTGNMTSKSVNPVSSRATLDPFADDDDELDSLLASIDTDSL